MLKKSFLRSCELLDKLSGVRMKKGIPLVVLTVLVLSVLACSFTPRLVQNDSTITPVAATEQVEPTPTFPPVSGNALASDAILTSLYRRVNPGVVSLVMMSDESSSSGSGFVYDKEGHIITNYHVVEGFEVLEVDFPDGLKVYGEVIATDLDSDLAVIKVDVPQARLHPLTLGDSDALQVGQIVVAIGNPFRLSSTMTLGIISAKGRILDSMRAAEDSTPYSAGDIIQTDAAINPGNSGGPLINLAGEVVGINRAIRTSGTTTEGEPVNSGIGFAVSINVVKRVIPVLIEKGSYDYPYFGITSSSRDFTLMEWDALGISHTSGAYITGIVAGGPADQAGLKAGTQNTAIPGLLTGGDLIIGIDGHPVYVYGDLISYIMTNKSPGDEVVLTILREDQKKEVKLILGKRP